MPNTNISFFRGTTLDGAPWVMSFEGGPTATDPTPAVALLSVQGLKGRSRGCTFPRQSVSSASEMRSLLPHLNLSEVTSEWMATFRPVGS